MSESRRRGLSSDAESEAGVLSIIGYRFVNGERCVQSCYAGPSKTSTVRYFFSITCSKLHFHT